MFKKIGITMAFVGAWMFSIGVVNTFAKNPNCPDNCNCPYNVKCPKSCSKDKTDYCTCKR